MYYSTDMDMYQIEDGKVVRSDSRKEILRIDSENAYKLTHMAFWMIDFEGQIIFNSNCYSSSGKSEIDDESHGFGCVFEDGKIVDGAPSIYREGYENKTENGEVYTSTGWVWGDYANNGDKLACIEANYSTMQGAEYEAAEFTRLYDYINGFAKPEAYEPLKITSVERQQTRADVVKANVVQAVETAMNAAGMQAYNFGVSCDRTTGNVTQAIIYSDEYDYGAVDTGKLRAMALAILRCPDTAATADAAAVMQGFEFKKKGSNNAYADGCEISFVMIPDGSYALLLNFNR